MLETTVVATPAGPLALVADPVSGMVLASGFSSMADQIARLGERATGAQAVRTSHAIGPVVAAVSAYGDGQLLSLDSVAVYQPGGAFMQSAWTALRGVGPGQTVTYTDLAELAGSPRAVRAAGSACARNLVAPFVPCHRVVRRDGSLGGYYYGLPIKAALLIHEGVLLN